VKDSHFVHPHPHPPPSKGEGIICCYYKRFSYPLCQVRVKLSPQGGRVRVGVNVILFSAFVLENGEEIAVLVSRRCVNPRLGVHIALSYISC